MDLTTMLNNIRTARDAALDEAKRLNTCLQVLGLGGAKVPLVASAGSARPRRTLSARGREAIAKAQRERWARARAEKTGELAPKKKQHWTQTPAGREVMRKSAKARFGHGKK